jgi:LysR family transcriptional regulator, transcriptional activator of nhaA
MESLNYHHLYYFSVIAREGGLAAAARKLHLTHSTLSAQLRALEEHFGAKLFERRGKRLVLTPFGADAASYAEDIFRLGRELNDVARGRVSPGRRALRVGAVAGLPKTLVHHLLAPALDHPDAGSAHAIQRSLPELIDALHAGRLSLALSDELPTSTSADRVRAHLLGATKIILFANGNLGRTLKKDFPASLQDRPFVLPSANVALRRGLDAWLLRKKLRVRVVAEVEDAGLLRVFGGAGRGVFPVRAALRAEVEDVHGVEELGPCDALLERYYLLYADQRFDHPAVSAIVQGARQGLHAVRRPSTPKAAGSA